MSSLRMTYAAVFVACAAAACGGSAPSTDHASQAPPPATAQQPPPQGAARGVDAGDAMPDGLPALPLTPFPAARPMPVVREIYAFAAQHPEVLKTVPCFCGCESRGHHDNDDCFVARRDANGKVAEWEPHGVG